MNFETFHSGGATCIIFAFESTLDHAQVVGMAEVVEDAIRKGGELRPLLDLRRTETFSPGAFLSPKAFLTSIHSIGPVSRYAAVGAPAIAAAAVESFGTILPLESRAFDASDMIEARDWMLAAR